MTGRDRTLLGVLLRIVDAGRWLAPPSRRRDWRRQWRADLWHEWNWLAARRSVPAGFESFAAPPAPSATHSRFGCTSGEWK
jgi:hypothetical protein